MRTLVITSCTGEKAIQREDSLTLDDFRDCDRLRVREEALSACTLPATDMYTGLQHVRLKQGVRLWREALGRQTLDVAIVSAGYGLVEEGRFIVPYEVTFNTMSRTEIVTWSRQLRIPEAVRERVRGYPLVIFLLGDKYLQAVHVPLMPEPSQRLIFLGGAVLDRQVQIRGTTMVAAGREEATKYSEGIVALKGKMFLLFARGLIGGGRGAWDRVMNDESSRSFLTVLDAANDFCRASVDPTHIGQADRSL